MSEVPYLISSVDKALNTVRILRDRGPTGVSELGAELQVVRSTAHRILGTLMHHGFVEQDPTTRAYRLGPFLTGLGVESAALDHLRAVAMPHVRLLSETFRETVQLVVREGAIARFIGGVAGDRPLNAAVQSGSGVPAHATASGKALLAELSDERVRALYTTGVARMTDQTLDNVPGLLNELRTVRERGYATNNGESTHGIWGLAVPVRDRTGEAIASLSMILPSVRVRSEDVPTLAAELRRCAERITADLSEDAR